MESILEAFANDNLEVLPLSYPDSPKSDYLLKEANRISTVLEPLLNTSAKELLNKLEDIHSKLGEISATERFIQGYRLGVLMTFDVFNGLDSLMLQNKGGKLNE